MVELHQQVETQILVLAVAVAHQQLAAQEREQLAETAEMEPHHQ
jgi:hypothetical protein